MNDLELFFLLFFVVIISFFHDLDEEVSFAIIANELFVVSSVELSGTEGAERDFSLHLS